jgi:hypothetical protein
MPLERWSRLIQRSFDRKEDKFGDLAFRRIRGRNDPLRRDDGGSVFSSESHGIVSDRGLSTFAITRYLFRAEEDSPPCMLRESGTRFSALQAGLSFLHVCDEHALKSKSE